MDPLGAGGEGAENQQGEEQKQEQQLPLQHQSQGGLWRLLQR